MRIAVQVETASPDAPPSVDYTWDADTGILSAQLTPKQPGKGMSGSVGLEGSDGSWVILDVAAGRISGVEVPVWPELRKLPALSPPSRIEDARILVPMRQSQPNIASLEMSAKLVAEADAEERNFHFRLGKPRDARTVRVARDILLDLDEKSNIIGLWLLNVPPCPVEQ